MQLSLDQVVAVIRSTRPDIVALQEIDVACPRTSEVNQAGEIGSRLGMNSHFCCLVEWNLFPHFKEPIGQYGLAFLCPPDLHPHRLSRWNLPFANEMSEPRGIFQIEIGWKGTPVMILNTHLSVRRRERITQLRAICQRIDDLRPQGEACILMGDFNSSGSSRELRMLRQRVPECSPSKPPKATFPSRFPLLRLDRVFASPDLKCLDSRVINSPLARSASDHLPVLVELRG